MGFTPKHLHTLTPQQAVPVLAIYTDAVASGLNLVGKATLQTKTISNYLTAAVFTLEIILQQPIPYKDLKGSLLPIIADTLNFRQKWTAPNEKREPLTSKMFLAFHHHITQLAAMHKNAFLRTEYAIFDWTGLSTFTGSRVGEYAQTNQRIGQYSKAPVCPNDPKWSQSPLAFISEDFVFWTATMTRLPHSDLCEKYKQVAYLHVRFRFDKSKINFSIRKFARSGHTFLCPIIRAISIIFRHKALRVPVHEPLGIIGVPHGDKPYQYLRSQQIITLLRKICLIAHPDKNDYHHQHVLSIVAHSNRVTAAVALWNIHVPIPEIAFRLRWREASVEHYLRECNKSIGDLTQKAITGALNIT
jgi:hypothetical protein